MSQRVNIPSQNQPFRRQSSIGGNVSFRNIGENNDNSFITLAKVTRVYYQQGKLDFKLSNTNSLVADQSGNGSGSAPIPVDFFGRRPNGQVFGHYRPVKIGDLIAVAYVNGHKGSPIVIGVYPNSAQDYEIVSPSLYVDGDDNDSGVAETALAEQKIYPSMQLEYRSGSGVIAKALNGHSFLVVDDETSAQYSKLWQNYDTVGFFHSNSDAINPLKETAGDWLLVHEDNPLSDDGDNHRTRFFVNKKGEIQIVLMDNTSTGTISVLDGSKDRGFTISQYYDLSKVKSGDLSDDVYEPDFNSAADYVSLNVGKGKQISLDAAGQTKLEIKKDGIYYNGKSLSEAIKGGEAGSITKDLQDQITKDVKDQITSSDDWKKFQDNVDQASSEAKNAAEKAKNAAEKAKEAGASAEAAGDDAKKAGDDIKKRIIYYASVSKEKDIAIPGKYIIINTDTYIAKGTIKNAYIEDGAIDNAKIANGAIDSAQIKNGAITNAKIADLAVGTAQIEDAAITDAKIGSLSADKITTGTLDADKIKVVNLTAANIKAGSITADSLKIGKLSEITGDAGQITKGHIQASDDPNSGVQIDGLDADNPNKYTPAKKAFLLSEVKKLNSAAEAAIDYGKQTGTDYSAVEKAKKAMDDGLASLLSPGNMATTTEFDYKTVIRLEQDLQDAVNAFHSKTNSDIMSQIGTTADGKNAIYRGAEDPVTAGKQPHENDMWLQILSNGTYNIRVWDGAQWINPGLADVKAVSDSLSGLSKSYYQPEEPVGGDVHDGDTWYKLTKGTDGAYHYETYHYNSKDKGWEQLLPEQSNESKAQIAQLKSTLDDSIKALNTATANNLDKVKSDLTDKYNDLSKQASDLAQKTGNLDDAQKALVKQVTGIDSDLAQNYADALNKVTNLKKTLEKELSDNAGKQDQATQDLQTQLADAQSKLTNIQTQVNKEIKDATDKINDSNSKLITQVEAAQTALDKAKADIATQTSKDLTDKFNQAQANLDTAKQALLDQISKTKDGLTAANKKLADDLATAQTNFDNAKQALDKSNADLASKVNKTADDIQANQEAQANLQAAQKQLKDAQSNLLASMSDLNTKITKVSTDVEKNNEKIELKADRSDLAYLSGRMNLDKARFKVSADEIVSEVSEVKANAKDSLVGGNNLLEDSDKSTSATFTKIGTLTLAELQSLRGKTVTVSVDVSWKDFTPSAIGQNRIGWEVYSTYYDDAGRVCDYYLGAWKYPNTPNGSERVSSTFTIPDRVFRNCDGGLAYIYIPSGTVSHPQVQLGTNATAWNKGSKDIDQKIISLDSKINQTKKYITGTVVKKIQDGLDPTNIIKNIAQVKITSEQVTSAVSDSLLGRIAALKQTADTFDLTIGQNAVLKNKVYSGVHLDENGLTVKANNVITTLNNNGFNIQNGNNDIFKVDNKGNLTLKGNIIGGDISGVNFTGDNLTLLGSMKVNGQILFANSNGVFNGVLSSRGLSLKGGGLSISDNKGNLTTYVDDEGTFITDKGYFKGEVHTNKLILTGSESDINVAGKFKVNSTGDVIANSITITGNQNNNANNSASLNGVSIYGGSVIEGNTITGGTINGTQINAVTINASSTINGGIINGGTIAGSTIYALNNNGSQDPKLAPKSDWYQITPNMIRWFNHYDQSVGQIGVGQGVRVNGGASEFTGTPGLTISDSAKILLGTAQRTVNYGDEIGNLETTGLDWMSKTNLEIKADELKINLDPDQGNEYDGKGAGFSVQKDKKIGAYFGSGDHGNELNIQTAGDNNHITFTTDYFNVYGQVSFPNNGLTVKELHVTHWLGVDGSKNSIVKTSQGTVAINAYETAEYYFGDIGEEQTNGDGKVWISIDYLFGQTVNTSVPYQVFVTPYSSAHVWVSKRLKNRFLVESDKPNASFAWEIKAKRKGYEHTRLRNVDNMIEKPAGIK